MCEFVMADDDGQSSWKGSPARVKKADVDIVLPNMRGQRPRLEPRCHPRDSRRIAMVQVVGLQRM